MAEGFRCALVGWGEVELWVADIVRAMARAEFRPEVIIGMSRGGIVPARLIADHLVIKHLYTVKTEHWGLTATPDGKAKLAQAVHVDVTGKRVLIVDDITDTGQSLMLAREHVAALHPGALATATLLHIGHSLVTPDFFAKHVEKDHWTWFIFPWNVREDLRNILPKALDDAATLGELKAVLKERFKIEVPGDVLKEALDACVEAGTVGATKGKFKALPPAG